jgi:hypothetical protein
MAVAAADELLEMICPPSTEAPFLLWQDRLWRLTPGGYAGS